MTQTTGNNHPRVVSGINEAIDLAANDQNSVAVQLLTALAEEFPQASSVHGYLAWFLLQIGRHQEAIEHSREAVSLSPKSERASLVHFHVLWKAGQHIQALDEMKRFLTIRPSQEYADIIKDWEPGKGTRQDNQ
ncbi:MAG: tetratricopeptide repeat protein [Thermoguttaceae bacterium]|jgi:tetratricopeptide (TPR) repeat protein